MTSIRRMSLDHHPGFDCGGTLWFQNLTEFPHGVLSPAFPLLIAGLHFVNVQFSFRGSSLAKTNDLFSKLAKFYKLYLNLLSFSIFAIGFYIPQGSLVYWLTNSTLTLIQQISLNHRRVREKLGLPQKDTAMATANPKEMDTHGVELLDAQTKPQKVSAESLSPRQLLALSVKLLAERDRERAVPLLRLALEKDPDYVRALLVMGQTLLQIGLPVEACQYLERAISRLFLVGNLVEGEEDADLLILASQWAGVAYVRQGKNSEGIVHLERVAQSKEPGDSKSKAHYYDGLLLLASALYNEGRKTEAAKYLRKAAAYDSKYIEYLEQCEKDDDNFVNDLVSTRRSDY